MTTKRFFLIVLFLGGVALGWVARGENDGAVTDTAVMTEVEKAVALETARSEKQIRDLQMGKDDLQDKLAVASAKDAKIERMQKEIADLQSQLIDAKVAAKIAEQSPSKTTTETVPVDPVKVEPAPDASPK